ncbi:hypothetical protein BDN72DRAFT_757313 [Pluteus cervinus]|uniref:Uncharacterized protein n=1 Tax=Pluteus cervinus TaxID=181527 RepID=A0ACD3BDJ5_9AGAR|nr:hypothetical protein BDN72DRAFT_757313 [Pluteus cervinus]
MSESSSLETGPFTLITVPTIPQEKKDEIAEVFYWDMSCVHNCLIRGMNSVWLTAPHVKPKDQASFLGYCITLIETIHMHHHGEEVTVFPALAKQLNMEHNLEQHESFQGAMDEFEKYIKDVQAKKEKYDGQRTRDLLKAFSDPLVQHLHDEILTIAPEQLLKVDQADLDAMMAGMAKHIKEASLFTTFPFVLSHHNFSEIPEWPPAPAPLMWFARNISYRRYSNYWKFSPWNNKGRLQSYVQTVAA